jgi:enediyne biosynthesis protein E4
VSSRRWVAAVAALAAIAIVGVGIAASAGGLLGRTATPTAALPPPAFVDETATSGLAQIYVGAEIDQVGGGIAVLDCNDDGRPEVFLVGGMAASALYRNDSEPGGTLRFTRLPSPVTDVDATGAYPLDVDSDGRTDLMVLRMGETLLLRGLGECRFERANEPFGFDAGTGYATAFAATWEPGEQLPTIAIGRYLELDGAGQPTLDCDNEQVLLRPNPGALTYARATALSPGYCALSMLFSDWDRSGRRDLRISNDRHYYDYVLGEEQLWRMDPGQPPVRYTADDGWVQVQIEGMGIATQDLTGDSYPEVFLTSQAANRLQTLTTGPDQPMYRDIGHRLGLSAVQPFTGGDTRPSTAWHPQFEDVNRDGFVDLFIAKGNVGDDPHFATKDPSNLLLGQPDGTFVEAADRAGILNWERGRGAALADLNLDGLLDLVLVNLDGPAVVWRNTGPSAAMGHWLGLRLTQAAPNPDAVGAWVEVRVGERTLLREITLGGGHVSGQQTWIEFGLGPATSADVRVTWPDGAVGDWARLDGDRFVVVDKTAGVQAWPPAP